MEQLRSRSSFILLHISTAIVYIWHGAKSPAHTVQRAKEIAVRLQNRYGWIESNRRNKLKGFSVGRNCQQTKKWLGCFRREIIIGFDRQFPTDVVNFNNKLKTRFWRVTIIMHYKNSYVCLFVWAIWLGLTDAVLQVSWSVVVPRLLLYSSRIGAPNGSPDQSTHTSVLCDETPAHQSRS